MAVDDAALDRLREDLLVAIRAAILDSEHRIRGEVVDAVSASEHRLGGEISASETRLETRLEARLGAKIEASAAETRRHMGVVAEDLTSKIALVAEGVLTLTERLGAEMSDGFDILDRRLLRLETRLLSSPERS
jgi:chromosomal replication initiation ATPase DnaA